ncbi:PTS fructose transporter subunit IIABC [Dellaglioa algida]|uniref:PTS fructose transporter subunit IIABC n=1 Tax=Dellaglioa algida TaxID=105612 RepID=UPI000BC557D1|nr:fructose-specific PTS transporter subunit EIIC [Dellaglioa algida]MDK1718177.1 fructose-specific PTS transporter subunit EIIC [Dellaglioa algida]MDK1729053.1 fructose-specific PTS transporter subunit EIIC [Dellaglioa algida]MDK1741487.1 fructose-specific PTS transporter subunit EIIC [Dellaglioa algida]SOB49761.1 phosphotransferase system (PTS) fructose-specific enzyme IIABC component [Dellaglioa algida]
MDLNELLLKDVMIMDLQATTKTEAIDEMVHKYFEAGVIDDEDLYKQDILKREAQSTTGIGEGIAMPHAKNKAVKRATVLFAKSKMGLDYDSLDGQPTFLFFMIAAPEGANDAHLQALAALSSLLINPDLVSKLKTVTTPDEVQSAFTAAENEKEAKEIASRLAAKNNDAKPSGNPYIVAVTACPTGIAHTYMAEAALIKQAEEMGVDIKVETNGSEGIKHRLTDEEIQRASGVIVAADKKVAMDRFNGKPLINRPVTDGIKKPEELINSAVSGKAPIYHAKGMDAAETDEETSGSVWNEIYKNLMNGVSHMLPFVVGGGILMALSFIVEQYVPGGSQSQTFIFLNGIGNYAFAFLVPILAGFIAMSIGDRPALMPGIVGGYMANFAAANVIKTESVSGFLGGLAAGFIAGYVIVGLKKLFKNLPKSLDGMKPILIYPILSLLIVGAIMFFMVNPVFAQINHVLSDFLTHMGTANAVLIGTILAAMMAIDMGGPFNKAAYTFSIGVFTSTGDGKMMAAVMVGGMIPPLAIAIASTFWKNKFSEDERKAGLSNYILGISFITEGAIPYAAADPLHVITSSVIGAAIGGGLSQFWNVSVPAPHGGLWVIALATNKTFYLLSVLIGAAVAGIILGIWRPVAKENKK